MHNRAAPLRGIGIEAVGVYLRTATGNAFELKLGNMEEESSDSEETL